MTTVCYGKPDFQSTKARSAFAESTFHTLHLGLNLFTHEQLCERVRHKCITPSQRLRIIRVHQAEIIIRDEMRQYNLCHDDNIETPGAKRGNNQLLNSY